MRKVWNLSFKRLETLNIAKKRSILGVSAAQDSLLKNVNFSKFVSQQPQTVLKVSSFKVINQRFFLVLTRTYFEEKLSVVVSDIPTNLTSNCLIIFNPLSANPKKWSNTLKQFVGNLTNCLNVFDHFVKLAIGGLMNKSRTFQGIILICTKT